MKMKELACAKNIMQSSLKHAIESGDGICIGCAYRGMGEIMRACGSENEARMYFEQAMQSFKEAGDVIAVEEVKAMC